MIGGFHDKSLWRLFENDDRRGIRPDLVPRVALLLSYLDAAETLDDLALPSLRLHPLKGDLRGFWSITVRANWRIIFKFADGVATDVELLDYH